LIVRGVVLLLTVMESLPSRVLIVSKLEIAVPSTVPAAEALMTRLLLEALVLRVSEPAPALRDVREAPVAMVAVSAPEPRVTFSRFEKAIDPRVPEFAAETLRVSAVVVEVRESVPVPVFSAVGSDPLRVVELIVTESSPTFRLLIPAELNAVVTSAAVPEIALIASALTARVVWPSRVLSAAALTDESPTVMEYALPMPVRPPRVEMAVSLMVAVTTPVVWASMLFAWATLALPLLMLTATLAAVSMEAVLIAVSIAVAVPVSVATELALMVPDVFPSRVLRSVAAREVSERVTASLPRPVMPEAPVEL